MGRLVVDTGCFILSYSCSCGAELHSSLMVAASSGDMESRLILSMVFPHSVPIDMRVFCRPGRLCWGSIAMWDDVMISPFGILIGISWVAVCLFVHGVVGVM